MKKNKFEEILNNDSRQLSLIDKYYSLNREEKTIDIDFRYEKASDVLDEHIGNKNTPQFNKEILEEIDSVFGNIPTGFKVNINFFVNDYQGYDAKKILETFNSTLELRRYNSKKKRLNKQLFSAILVLIGVLILFLMIVGKNYFLFKDQIQEDIVSEVLDIAAWVFIWEAVTLLFLETPNDAKLAVEIRKKVNTLSFYNKDGDLLCKETRDEIYKNWESISKVKIASRYMILISSVAFLFMAVYSSYVFFLNLENLTATKDIILSILKLVIGVFLKIFAGVSGFRIFLKKPIKCRRFLDIYTLFVSLAFCFSIIDIIVNNQYKFLGSEISSFSISILYCIGYYTNRFLK